jgi:hypothetical protein
MKIHSINRSLDKFKAGLFHLGIISIITVVIWIGMSLYATYSKSTIDAGIQSIIKPINPSLDNQVLLKYSQTRISQPTQYKIVSIVKEGNQITQVLLDPSTIASPASNLFP